MTKKQKIKTGIIIIFIAVLVILTLGIQQLLVLHKAHSTFDNYYAFRGCVQLIDKADSYGTCKTASGQIIKIVKIQNQWYLDGDGPGIW